VNLLQLLQQRIASGLYLRHRLMPPETRGLAVVVETLSAAHVAPLAEDRSKAITLVFAVVARAAPSITSSMKQTYHA
jgi:hypothetical protein